MRVHSTKQIKRLKELRKKGYSINEIVTELSIPKTTVWYYTQEVRVLPKYVSVLRSKRGGRKKRLEEDWARAAEDARKLLQGSDRESLITIAMLYWAEGSKKGCEFINSDGRMIKLYLAVMREVLGISEDRIKPTLRIFSGMDQVDCLNYWSDITRIPKHSFIVRLNDGGTRGHTRYGMCRITIRKGGYTLKVVNSLIEQSTDELTGRILSYARRPRSSIG